ncbi:MAG: phenylalanine--tRNA ligase subunit beta [Caldisericia bacterium]|nr:phenylalanine--tRNA ligase subunit beta [Caldisericia bacterium]
MIVSYGFLQTILKKECPPAEDFYKRFGEIGFEVENYIKPIKNNVIIVEVIEVTEVPEYTKLKKVILTDGKETHQVVTNWQGVQVGNKYTWAAPGTQVNDFILTKKDFKGTYSEGMLLSYKELQLEPINLSHQEREGLLVLPKDTPIGENFYDLFWLSKPAFDLKIPYNRPDCYSMVGLLREIVAAFSLNISPSERKKIHHIYPGFSEILLKRNVKNENFKGIKVSNKTDCPYYAGALISGVSIKPSLYEIRRRLFAFRIRPINNVVDIANLVMFYYQQPLHTFDFDRLVGKTIEVRNPISPEVFNAIDGKEYSINEKDLVIADEVRPIAIAGIIGSSDSEIVESSRNIFIECAYFKPSTISVTSARLNLTTDASSRYARGVDYKQLDEILKISTYLICALCGGAIDGEFMFVKNAFVPPQDIDLSLEEYTNITGLTISKYQASNILNKLEIPFDNCMGDIMRIHPPSFRRMDLKENVDIIEELLRFSGYDKITPTKPVYEIEYKPEKPWIKMNRKIRQQMIALGFFEVLTDSFAKDEEVKLLYHLDTPGLVQVQNPLRKDQSYLTPNRVLALLAIAKRNIAMKNSDLRLFELGSHYLNGETKHLDWIVTGFNRCQTCHQKPRQMDFYYAKGIKENSILSRYKIPFTTKICTNNVLFDKQQALDVIADGKVIGTYGKVSKEILDYYDIQQPVFYSTMELNPIMKYLIRHGEYKPVSLNQDIVRDIAFLVDKNVPAGDITNQIKATAGIVLKNSIIFDLYQGKNIDETKKSIAIRLLLNFGQNATGEQIQKVIDSIVEDLTTKFSIKLRS